MPKVTEPGIMKVTFEEHQREDASNATIYTDIEELEDIPNTDSIEVDDKEHLCVQDRSLIQVYFLSAYINIKNWTSH